MVQHRDQPQDFYTNRSDWQHAPQDGRYTTNLSMRPAQSVHGRYLTVEDSLRNCAGIPVRDFAVMAILENGDLKVYSSQSLKPFQDNIFNKNVLQTFRHSVHAASDRKHSAYQMNTTFPTSSSNDFDLDTNHHEAENQSSSGGSSSEPHRSRRRQQYQQRASKSKDSDDDSLKLRRKRARPTQRRYGDIDEPSVPIVVSTKSHSLMIGNEAEVRKLYECRFKDMQQTACKMLGKAFVKLLEPKKQTNYPYTKQDAGAPPWWPLTPGPYYVRHKEPDHQLKPERIQLLVHIVRIVVEPPERQPPSLRKLNLNVQKLEDVTMEAISNWLNDKDHPGNAEKRQFLREVFTVAKKEERYKRGEIDAEYSVHVMHENGSTGHGSDDEVDEGDEYDDREAPPSIPSGVASSDEMVSPTMLQPHSEADHVSIFESNNRNRPATMRYESNPHVEEQQATFNDPNCYSREMQLTFPGPIALDPNRRNFASPVYTGSQNVFGWGAQNSLASNGPVASSYYTTSGLPSHNSNQTQYQLPPPPNQHSMLRSSGNHHFDGLPAARSFDVSPPLGNQLRTGSLGHPHQMPHGYHDYVPDNDGFINTDHDVKPGIHHVER